MSLDRGEAVVAASIAAWSSPLEDALFGTSEPRAMLRLLDDFCVSVLGQPLHTVIFYGRGVGAVFGIVLGDDRRVVIKVHRSDLVGDTLHGIRQVQQHLADVGFPAPRPLGAPSPLGLGLATAEELLDRGGVVNAHEPGIRRDLARGLRRFVEAAMPLVVTVGLGVAHPFGLAPDQLWPTPHDFRFDFSLPGGEWIDDLAAEARSALRNPGPMVIGHLDWRVENVRLDEGLAAVFDWDSVGLTPEPALVGKTAASFTSNWNDPSSGDPYPSPEEVSAFVAEYEQARGAAFSSDERRTASAAYTYSLAYHARCEHSDVTLKLFPNFDPHHGWRSLLRTLPRLPLS